MLACAACGARHRTIEYAVVCAMRHQGVLIDRAHHVGGVVLDDRTLTMYADPRRKRGTFTQIAYDGTVKRYVDPWIVPRCPDG